MQRLIDLNKTISELKTLPEQERLEYMGVYDLLKSMPTIEAEPVVHGHWVKRYKSKYYHCSVCGGLVEDEWHNCPHCRSKMDEKQKCET